MLHFLLFFFFFQAEDGIRDSSVTGVQTCALPIYPFTRGYKDPNGVLSPPNGQVFDEVYFPVDARSDVKGMEKCKSSTVDCPYNYFDPEPPLGKEMIAAGEWAERLVHATLHRAQRHHTDLDDNTNGWRIAPPIPRPLCR